MLSLWLKVTLALRRRRVKGLLNRGALPAVPARGQQADRNLVNNLNWGPDKVAAERVQILKTATWALPPKCPAAGAASTKSRKRY